jgi:hypothetical protein
MLSVHLARQNAMTTEKERVRRRFADLADKAMDTFEDIMQNSDDDKARNIAASKVMDMWAMSNDLSQKVDVSGMEGMGDGVTNIQINVNSLRDVLNSATRGMSDRGPGSSNKVELLDLIDEIDTLTHSVDLDESVPLVDVKPKKKSGLIKP